MRDITHKQITLRTAHAIGIIFCTAETVALIERDELPKGNLFDVARAAAFIGAKKTPDLLPANLVLIERNGLLEFPSCPF